MNVKGKLVEKFDTQQISERLKKREFVLEVVESNPMYPEYIKFELIQDRTTLIDPFNIGDMLDVAFNLKGRPWTNPQGVKNYFNSLQAWKIAADNGASAPAAPQANYQQTPQAAPQTNYSQPSPSLAPASEDDDLPF